MSLSQAMQIGISGLSANSQRVGNISQNIANANTDGYKRSFSQLVTSVTGSSELTEGAGVRANDRTEVAEAGALRTTTSSTDLAISGEGFFVVSKFVNDPNEANYALTRAGSFLPDEDGNLVNAAGLYLAGRPYNADGTLSAADGNSMSQLTTVNIANRTINGNPTSEMSIVANLPSQTTGVATPGAPFVSSAEYFTALGEAERVQFSWQPTATDNLWTLTVSDTTSGVLGSVDVTFSDSGPTAGSPLSYTNITNLGTAPAAFAFNPATGAATLTLDNATTPQSIDINLGAPGAFSGITQFAGDYSGLTSEQDGIQSGNLLRAEIEADGTVYGVFDNGTRSPLYEIPLAMVANPNGLTERDGNAYRVSRSSGPVSILSAGAGGSGSVTANALEGSNVDVAGELTDLIEAQRAYSSNAKIVTTSDQMLEETLQIKR
ncbi:flagellar hook protein FlgE [Litorisediminicola beolgyonensis]|uniref:Flagellar hook protein FlgE n=1 Tax=Litorisediminicola beolgyonensis TaxID=1173614 RepID=A0ABW3ZFS2_9RHOB